MFSAFIKADRHVTATDMEIDIFYNVHTFSLCSSWSVSGQFLILGIFSPLYYGNAIRGTLESWTWLIGGSWFVPQKPFQNKVFFGIQSKMILSNNFQFLNNIICIFTYFFITYFHPYKSIKDILRIGCCNLQSGYARDVFGKFLLSTYLPPTTNPTPPVQSSAKIQVIAKDHRSPPTGESQIPWKIHEKPQCCHNPPIVFGWNSSGFVAFLLIFRERESFFWWTFRERS